MTPQPATRRRAPAAPGARPSGARPPPAGRRCSARAWRRARRRAARARIVDGAAHGLDRASSRATSARCWSTLPPRRHAGADARLGGARGGPCMSAPSAPRASSSACATTRACSSRRARCAASRSARRWRRAAGARSRPRRRSPSGRWRARYGLGRELFERAMDVLRVDMCFLEITPGPWEGDGPRASVDRGRRVGRQRRRAASASARAAPSATNDGGAIAR